MSFEDLQKANETIKTLDVKGKEYAEVNQRIKAFRMLYPEGCIETEILQQEKTTMLGNETNVVVFKATIKNSDGKILGIGHAYEKEGSTFINKTSYIENCETSAVGRALAMCGIGIDTSVASAEEVQNAINNQVNEDEAKAFKFLTGKHKGKTIEEIAKEDEDYLIWWLDQGKDEKIKQMITLITGLAPTPMPSEEEQQERFNLLARFQQLLDTTNSDYDKLLKHYRVTSNADLTNEQLKDAINVMEKKQ